MPNNDYEKTAPLLEEILKWIKFEGRIKAKEIFSSELDTDTKKLVYELSDGKSSADIAKTVKVSAPTVRDYWHRWAEKGMMELCPDYKRRYCKIFTLGELGIEVPEIESSEETKEDENE